MLTLQRLFISYSLLFLMETENEREYQNNISTRIFSEHGFQFGSWGDDTYKTIYIHEIETMIYIGPTLKPR